MISGDETGKFQALIIMGVSGCGKTTIASALAEKLGWAFIESDEYHSEDQIRKMAGGTPLTDADRQPWLEILQALLAENCRKNQPVVMACSALKKNTGRISLPDWRKSALFISGVTMALSGSACRIGSIT